MTRTFDRRRGLVLLVAVVGAVSLWLVPEAIPAKPPTQDDPSELMTLDEWPMSPAAARGKTVYAKYCIGCHGAEGAGDGEAAEFLNPLPRNFQKGSFKFRSTPSGQLPTMADLMRTITCGLIGSSMPSFRLLSDHERSDVANYVLHVATLKDGRLAIEDEMSSSGMTADKVRAEKLSAIKQAVWKERVQDVTPIGVPPSPPADAALLELGKKRYMAECSKCHGDTGVGDGTSSYTLRDWRDAEIRARDFTSGVFRAGSTPQDIFLRLRSGLTGTPMPAISGDDREIWALVHYILSLRSPSAKKPNPLAGCAEGETR